VSQYIARFGGAGWIDGHGSFVDMANDALFIDYESSSISVALFLVEDSVVLNHSPFEVAQYGKGNAQLFCKFPVGWNAVHTQTKNLRFGCFEFGDISLIRLQLLRSTTGKRQHINREHHVFGAFEVA
jgi:hypothetical protein